ncbi:MAG: hypothetical protein Q7J67_00905 [bacterium]|nr:hypothetical protein [bacterium]
MDKKITGGKGYMGNTKTRRAGRPASGKDRKVLDSYSIDPALFKRLQDAIGKIKDSEGKVLSKAVCRE